MNKLLMVLADEFPPDIRVENEIKSLLGAGYEVHIACQTRKSLPITDHYLQCKIHRAPISKLVFKSSIGCLDIPIYFNFWKRFINRLFKKFGYAAIHIHDLPLARIGYKMSQIYKVPFILDLHENWPSLMGISTHTKTLIGRMFFSEKRWRNYETLMCQYADRVIVVVEEAKERLIKQGVSGNKISVVSNTPDIQKLGILNFSSLEKKNWPTLFYGGGISYHRGLQVVLNSLPLLKTDFPTIKFSIAGNGNYLPELKNICVRLGIEANVEFYGNLPFTDMLAVLAKSDIAVIPHIKSPHTDNTVPHKIFQYMYYGIPILSSNCEPLERIINKNLSGLIYTHDSPESFNKTLRKLLSDYDYYREHAGQARGIIEHTYNWDIDGSVLIGIYRTLVSQQEV